MSNNCSYQTIVMNDEVDALTTVISLSMRADNKQKCFF